MVTKTSSLQVQFNPAPAYLFDYLTADIQTAECIFDLIDNSIDSARSTMAGAISDELPSDYSGVKIELRLNPDLVVVEDNCAGMSETTFTDLAFRSGVKSKHAYGIGHFGVGLKRAILKLGNQCTVVTDDGNAKLTLQFSRAELDQATDLTLPATKDESTSATFTRVEISDIPADTKRDLSAIRWNEMLTENLGRRYGLFIRKGLIIEVNGVAIEAFAPQPIENAHISLRSEKLLSHGVEVEIVAGVHEKYRFAKNARGFTAADPSNLAVHKQIAKEFGWYIVCNDRVILLHDQSYKTGWTKNWHNEYNGFVGWVHFRSKDPALLPWNTRKSDIVENSEVYADVLSKLQFIAQSYRQTTPLAKERRKEGAPSAKSKPQSLQTLTTAKAVVEGKATTTELSSIETLLPSNVAFASQQPRLAGLVSEAEKMRIADHPYASAILLRTVFDGAMRDYLKRHGKFVAMRNAVFDAKLKPEQVPSEKERKNYSPLLSDMMTWCINNSDVFPDPHARTCKLACQNFSKHLRTLNGIAHEDGNISNQAQVGGIRDDVLQGLLHVLGS